MKFLLIFQKIQRQISQKSHSIKKFSIYFSEIRYFALYKKLQQNEKKNLKILFKK